MTIHLTCSHCGSGIHVYPDENADSIQCDVCSQHQKVCFLPEHLQGVLSICPSCKHKDFYSQKDFNRRIGVFLFIVAAILSIYTYGISLIVLWLVDFFLFKKLGSVAICYKCQAVFRHILNMDQIAPYDHKANDRIVYSRDSKPSPPL